MAYTIALIPGDVIGREVIPEGLKALEALSKRYDFDLAFTEFPFSCSYYLAHGEMMLDFLGEKDAGRALLEAVERVTEQKVLTPDLGGSETTASFTDRVLENLE